MITDVGLPGGMNGRQVADAARVTRPKLKVLFVTGFAENAAVPVKAVFKRRQSPAAPWEAGKPAADAGDASVAREAQRSGDAPHRRRGFLGKSTL